MEKYGIPTAKYETYNSFQDACKALDDFSYPLVIKADGLCEGKGVEIVDTREDALRILEEMLIDKKFGDQGNMVVIEEYLDGIEVSLLCFVTENRIIPMESAKDYKKIHP